VPQTIYCVKDGGSPKTLTVSEEKVVRILIRSSDYGEGRITFHVEGGACVFTNLGSIPSAINGEEIDQTALRRGDVLAVGNMEFFLQDPKTSQTGEYQPQGNDPDIETQEILKGDAPGSEGEAGTTRPYVLASLPDGDEEEDEETVSMQGARGVYEDTHDTHDGDAETDPGAPAPATASGRGRVVRRLSASQDAQLPNRRRQNRGLFGRVRDIFRRQGEETERLEELLEEREKFLHKVGRAALSDDHVLGFPKESWPRIESGKSVHVNRGDVDLRAVEDFIEWRKRFQVIETEIEVLRKSLRQRGEEEEHGLTTDRVLRTEQQVEEERAYQASDDVLTEDLGAYRPAEEPLAPEPKEEGEGVRKKEDRRSGEMPVPRRRRRSRRR